MPDPQDNARPEGSSPDGRTRRQPPVIDVKAVEVSLDGSGTPMGSSGSGASSSPAARSPKGILAFLSPLRIVIAGWVCIVAGIAAGALWIYLAPDGIDGPQRNAPSPEAAAPDEMIERIAKLEAILRAPPDNDLGNRVAAFDAMLASLSDRIAALERSVRDTAAAARVAAERADKAAGLVDAAKKSGDEQNSAQQHDLGALEDLASRVKTLELLQTALGQKQDALDRLANTLTMPDRTVRVAIVAAALRSAVESNHPFTAELAAARSLGLDERALASLEPFAAAGLPTRNELFRDLSALVPELRRASAPPGRDLGYLDRLQASAVKMLNIRRVRDEPGDDAATVMGRIEFKMIRRDIGAVMAEMDKLPAPARELAQPWRAKALGRQNAVESAQLIATTPLAKLGEPGVRGPSSQ